MRYYRGKRVSGFGASVTTKVVKEIIMELLTNLEEKFCCEMVRNDDHLAAYRKYFPNTKDDAKKATALMKKRNILARIVEMRQIAARSAIMDGAKVISEWTKIATADVNDLVQYQRVNCRHCYGIDGAYQWKHEDEYAHAVAMMMSEQASKAALGMATNIELPSDKGGYGFQFNKKINDSCLNCFGEGIERLFIPDTRSIPEDSKRLYAGVKMTANGIEIKTRDQDAALLNLAKYFKLLGNDDKKDDNDGQVTINIIGGLPE